MTEMLQRGPSYPHPLLEVMYAASCVPACCEYSPLDFALLSICSCTIPLIRIYGLYVPAEGKALTPTKFLKPTSSTACLLPTTPTAVLEIT